MLAERYDLVVASWDFPAPAASDLIRRVRDSSEMSAIPVLVVSTRNSEDEVRAAREAGATDYVLRPLTRDEFRERIERLLLPLEAAPSALPESGVSES